MSRADTLAVKATTETAPALAVKTFVTVGPTGPMLTLPYAVIHPADGTDEATRLTGPALTEHPSFTLHLVGSTTDQVQAVCEQLKPKFVTNGRMVPPAVTGRRNYAGYWRSPIPIQVDDSVIPPLVYQVIELGWTSDPA